MQMELAGLTITRHAVERYRDRLKPGLPLGLARRDLEQLIARLGKMQDREPIWLDGSRHPDAVYVMLGDDVALPVVHGLVLTCIPKGERSVLSRGAKKRRKRAKRRKVKFMCREQRAELYRKRHPVPEIEEYA